MIGAQRTSPPFRAEHIGSLRRPEELIQKRLAFDAGKCSREELQACEDQAIKDIVQMQKNVGLKAITDGEFRRYAIFFDGFWGSLEGMTFVPRCPPERFSQLGASRRTETSPSWICTGKLKRIKPVYGPQFDGLKNFVTEDIGNPATKIAICAPEFMYIIHREHTFEKGVYNDIEEYFADMVKIYRAEIADFYSRGCRNLQIDDPWLTVADGATVKRMQASEINTDAELSRFIRLLNDCLEGRPNDMTVGVHLCRGNRKDGEHFAEGSY